LGIDTTPPPLKLSFRQRLTWGAHLFKAVAYQYHRPLLPHLKRLVPRNGVVVDVGAHAGQFAKLFSQLVPKGYVYAFEPGLYALSILKLVVKWRGLRNVRILRLGLSDASGSETLHVPLKRHGTMGFGLAHLGGPLGDRQTHAQTIRLTTLDLFVSEHMLHRLDFIKADIEGWEVNMLKGGMESIREFRPVIMIEINEAALARANARPQEIFDLLLPLDYRVFRTDENLDYQIWAAQGFAGTADYLFVPQEKTERVKLAASALP
jgi:FkbM family methyltransferase